MSGVLGSLNSGTFMMLSLPTVTDHDIPKLSIDLPTCKVRQFQCLCRNGRYAKMWYKGVSFTAEQCALVYLVDAAGTRTTTDTFLDMSQDFSLNVFYK